MKTKRFVSTLLALLLVCSLPVSAFAGDVDDNLAGETAETINAGDTMNVNSGTVITNDGTVTTNDGTVTKNYGTVGTNNGTVNRVYIPTTQHMVCLWRTAVAPSFGQEAAFWPLHPGASVRIVFT